MSTFQKVLDKVSHTVGIVFTCAVIFFAFVQIMVMMLR